jgi:hypothetical protein
VNPVKAGYIGNVTIITVPGLFPGLIDTKAIRADTIGVILQNLLHFGFVYIHRFTPAVTVSLTPKGPAAFLALLRIHPL